MDDLNYVLKYKQDIFFRFNIQNINIDCYIIFLKFFRSSFSARKCIPSQLYLFIKCLIFIILCGPFLVFSWFNATVTAYGKCFISFVDKIHCCFLVLSPIRTIYIWSTTTEIFNTITEHNKRQNHYLSLIPNYFDIYFNSIKKFVYDFICFITNYGFYVIAFWIHYMLFLIICRRSKVICYC